jgi:hypothetical protein
MLMLTACSSGSENRPAPTVFVEKQIVHPPRPKPVQLLDERWYACGNQVCMKPAEAKKVLRNKAEVGRYMREMDNLVDYYRKQ